MEKEKYQLSLNYEGENYEVTVDDLEVANLLLNDHSAAVTYLSTCFPNIFTRKEPEVSEPGTQQTQEADLKNQKSEVIWTKKKPSEEDLEATKMLLNLRQKYHKEFDDKKTIKAKLWSKIAQNLNENNFNVGLNAGERCRQKFSNLVKPYLGYIKLQKTTGEKKIDDVPPFFDEIHSILGSKHKVNPISLVDTMDLENNVMDQENETIDLSEDTIESIVDKKNGNNNPVPSTSTAQSNTHSSSKTLKEKIEIENRFKNVRSSVKPSSKLDSVLIEIQEERKAREKQFYAFNKHLKKSEKQKDRFLEILEKVFIPDSNKRKREDSSEDSDSE